MSRVSSKGKQCFSNNFFYNCFRTCSKKIRNNGENFSRIVNSAFYVSRGTFSWKSLFLNKKYVFRNLFVHLTKKIRTIGKNLRQVCQNCILRDQKNSLRKNFLPKIHSIVFGVWEQNFGILAETLQQRCQNGILHVQKKILRKNVFFRRHFFFSIFFELWAKNVCIMGGNFLAGLSQLNRTCPGEPSETKIFFEKSFCLSCFFFHFALNL